MKILFLTQVFPLPLDSGGKIKSYYTIKTLAQRHEVHVLTYARKDEELHLADELRKVCHSVELVPLRRGRLRQASDLALSLGLRKSFVVTRDYREAMQRGFRKLDSRITPDVVHIDHLQMAQFVSLDGARKTILDHHNVESIIVKRTAKASDSPAMRLYARIEWPKLQRYELDVCRKCDLVLTVSDEDRAAIQSLDPTIRRITSVPIGVDIDYFRPVERDPSSHNVLSVGTMYWPPNVDSMLYFCRSIFPKIREQMKDCTMTIAGQRPTPDVQALGELPGVTVTGYVEDDRAIAADCGVFIVPLRSGSGVRVKILNALAMALPVVSTSVGAEGLEVIDGRHLLIADTASAFADAVIRLLRNRKLADDLGRNGRELVCRKYSWQAVGTKLLSVYEAL